MATHISPVHAFLASGRSMMTVVTCPSLATRTFWWYDGNSAGTGEMCTGSQANRQAPASHRVVCAHLHFDHVGWNTRLVDGAWVATFPNARYLFGRVESEHWSAETGPYMNVDETVRPVLEAGQAELVEVTHTVCKEVRFVPIPGHSRTWSSVRLPTRAQNTS